MSGEYWKRDILWISDKMLLIKHRRRIKLRAKLDSQKKYNNQKNQPSVCLCTDSFICSLSSAVMVKINAYNGFNLIGATPFKFVKVLMISILQYIGLVLKFMNRHFPWLISILTPVNWIIQTFVRHFKIATTLIARKKVSEIY